MYEKCTDGQVVCGEPGTTAKNADVFLVLFLFRRGCVSVLDPPAAPLCRVFRNPAAHTLGVMLPAQNVLPMRLLYYALNYTLHLFEEPL